MAKRVIVFWLVVASLFLGVTAPRAGVLVEAPRHCEQCGMDRAVFARSRVLLTYENGTVVGVCSIHCAAENMKAHGDVRVKAIVVADYYTERLIDAKKAFWVTGGKQPGVMTAVAKWAFATEAEAERFMAENGGQSSTYGQVLQAAEQEVASGVQPACACQGPGGIMLFNPAFGDDIYHNHPSGLWMFSFKTMHMYMDGLRDGTDNVPITSVGNRRGLPYDNYMMIPTSMHMEMDMFMAMYGINDRVTVMGMLNYLDNKMDMLMDMSPYNMMGQPKANDPGAQPDEPMGSSGLGDTELRGIYKLNDVLNASLGVSLPTGSINQEFTSMGTAWRIPYDMQLGSGTIDLKPAMTYNYLTEDALWNWGGQVMGTVHLGSNRNGYSLGDSLKVTAWLQRALGSATTWTRLAYSNTGRIDGYDPEIRKELDGGYMSPSMPDSDPSNYGGEIVNGSLGVSVPVGIYSVGFEASIPLYQDLHGLQMKNDWSFTVGLQSMF